MKKTLLYSFLPCLMAMLMWTTFTACSDDDDDNGGSANASALIGIWKFAGDLGGVEEYFVFNADGTGYYEHIYPDGETYKKEFTFKQEGNVVMFVESDEDEDEGGFILTERNGKIILDGGEDGYLYKV